MPKIPQYVKGSAFFLFGNEGKAKTGRDPGGTGFIVSLPSEREGENFDHHCAVTGHHAAVRRGYSCVRLKTRAGGTDVLCLEPHERHFDPRWGGMAVRRMSVDEERHQASSMHANVFMAPDEIGSLEVGFGEDVFMLGLFMGDAERLNSIRDNPMARFGHISVMPTPNALFGPPNYVARQRFIIDLPSRSGFSGSPAFAFGVSGADVTEPTGEPEFSPGSHFRLIGLHRAQFRENLQAEVVTKRQDGRAVNNINMERVNGQGLSGMTEVMPAWGIAALLRSGELIRRGGNLDMARKRPATRLEHGAADGGVQTASSSGLPWNGGRERVTDRSAACP